MLEFNIPNILTEENGAGGTFTIEPLERGYGTTLGNALRRVMLSSLPGAAVDFIKIDGVLHEFSTVPGVTEDVTEIVLNVKGIVLQKNDDTDVVGYIDFIGPGTVTAADIKCDSSIEIINPTHPIATVTEGARFYMELGFCQGRGYLSAEKKKTSGKQVPIGTILVDSIFTPVLKVSYTVENTRVGSQTDFDRLTIEVQTNGAISPTDAMAMASGIIIKHFECIAGLSHTPFAPTMIPDEQTQRMSDLDRSIEELDFSVRSFNCLKRAGVDTVGDLIQYTADELKKIRNLGQKSYDEILAKLDSMSLGLKEED